MSNIIPLDDHHDDLDTLDAPARHPARRAGAMNVIELAEDYWRLANRVASTEFVPTALRKRPEAVLAALLSGAERGLGPMQSLSQIHVIEGKPTLSAEAMRALVFAAGHTIDIVETTAQRATVVGRRAGATSTSPQFTWTIDRAKRARLTNKSNWQSYPESMLLARASADLCRAMFPDVVAGLIVTEEIDDYDDEPATTKRTAKRAPKRAPAAPAETTAIAPARTAADLPTAEPPPAPTAPATAPPPDRPQSHDNAELDLGGIPGAENPSWGTQRPPETAEQSAGAAHDDAIDAEIVDDDEHDPNRARKLHALITEALPDADPDMRDQARHALVAVVTRRRANGPVASSAELTRSEQDTAVDILDRVRAGTANITAGADPGTFEFRAGGGWVLTVDLDGPTVTTSRTGDDETEPDDRTEAG